MMWTIRRNGTRCDATAAGTCPAGTFGPGIVADEARSFDPGKPMAMPPVWLLVRGDATPERGLRCLTLAVTMLDGVDADGNVHAGVEVSYPCGLPEDALNGARFALWVLRDLLDGGSQEC